MIGNKNYSSWSLRAWLALRAGGIEFEEVRIPMFTERFKDEIGRHSPSRRVPVLVDGDLAVWDSLAICTHVLEKHPAAVGWPEDLPARVFARSITAEMHSGFLQVRDELPQNLKARTPLALVSSLRDRPQPGGPHSRDLGRRTAPIRR